MENKLPADLQQGVEDCVQYCFENQNHLTPHIAVRSAVEVWAQKVADLRTRCERMERALSWYADDGNYLGDNGELSTAYKNKMPNKAREAIAQETEQKEVKAIEYMPIHPEDARKLGCPKQFPMHLLNKDRAFSNHGQSLQRLKERGGLGVLEILAIVNDKPWAHYSKLKWDDALQKLKNILNHETPKLTLEQIQERKEAIEWIRNPGGMRWVTGEYDRLYEQLKSIPERQIPCFIDYYWDWQDCSQVVRDICSIRGSYMEFGARGIDYGGTAYLLDHENEKEKFLSECERLNVEWLDEGKEVENDA